MSDNQKDNQNFFRKLGHSLNLESKRFNQSYSSQNNEEPTPITDTGNLMQSEENGQQPAVPSPSLASTEQGDDMGDIAMNPSPPEPSQPEPVQPSPEQQIPVDNMNNENAMDSASDMNQPTLQQEQNTQPANLETESMEDLKQNLEMEEEQDKPMDEPQATLASTTLAKKHIAQTNSDSLYPKLENEVDGVLRPIDVYETKKEIVVKAIIAGVEKGDIQVAIGPESITISGQRQKQERISKDSYFYQELFWGSFSRTVMLPVEVDPDGAKASLKNGIFTIKIPKVVQQKERLLSISDIEEG